MDYKTYKANKEENIKALKDLYEELKPCANRVFSSPDGMKLANQMITAVKYFDCLPMGLKDEDLRYLQAQRDFVSVFLIGLVDKQTLLKILEER